MTTKLVEDTEKSKKNLKRKIEELGEELGYLQRKCRELGMPVLIVVEGWSATGKGSLINRIIQPLDPRGFKVSCIASPNRDEQLRPFLWRFWRRTPSADRMAIFDRSWYRNLLDDVVDGKLDEQEVEKMYSDIRFFERQLRDSGTIIFKFFLDISKKEQSVRLQALREKRELSLSEIFPLQNYPHSRMHLLCPRSIHLLVLIRGNTVKNLKSDSKKFMPCTMNFTACEFRW